MNLQEHIRRILREEINDFGWAEEYNQIIFKVGDKVIIKNIGPKESYEAFLGSYKTKFLKGLYGDEITGTVIEDNNTAKEPYFNIAENNTGDIISFPYENSDFIKQIYPNLKLEYYLIEDEEIIGEELEGIEWMLGDGPVQVTTTNGKTHWISNDTIKTGDFVVYQTASGLWREYGKINPEKVDDANTFKDYYKVIINK